MASLYKVNVDDEYGKVIDSRIDGRIMNVNDEFSLMQRMSIMSSISSSSKPSPPPLKAWLFWPP